jgi:presenilin-like A22 family membrane protease
MNLKNKKILPFFLFESFLYLSVFCLGIFSAKRAKVFFDFHRISPPKVSVSDFFFNVLFATFFLLFVIWFFKTKKAKGRIFKAIFLISVFFGGVILLEIWFLEPFPLIFVSLLIIWWLKDPNVFNQNLLISLGMAGVGSILGLRLKPEAAIFLLVIFSVYDLFAVYKTKHMVKIAKEMIEHKAILGIVISQNLSGFKEKLTEVRPGEKFVILGGGDIIFPLMLSVSLIEKGILASFLIAFFSLIGLFGNFILLFSQKERKPIPALPLISLFSILGFLLLKILK